jgi:hypothetical protein
MVQIVLDAIEDRAIQGYVPLISVVDERIPIAAVEDLRDARVAVVFPFLAPLLREFFSAAVALPIRP